MRTLPEIVVNHRGNPKKVSVILLDWGVRESYHSLEYLNKQTVQRDDYELIWLEFYNRKPPALQRLATTGRECQPAIDKWLVLGYPNDHLFHKHRLYNVGVLASEGDICVICDSDAIFRPTFIENVIEAFRETPNAVIHIDEVRNESKRQYPFHYPTVEEILGDDCLNWDGTTTTGLSAKRDRLHKANYGACMAARRSDLIAVGGADEHIDYLGYICGPYDLTFRLANYGRPERWLTDEYIYHVWHPNQSGFNTDYQGPHDGRCMSSLALHARVTGQIQPYVPNPWIAGFADDAPERLGELLDCVAAQSEPSWVVGAQPTCAPDFVYWIDKDYCGYNLFIHRDEWIGLRVKHGVFDPNKAVRGGYRHLLRTKDEATLRARIEYIHSWKTVGGIAGHVNWFVQRVQAQPLHRLPGRVWRKARNVLLSESGA